MTPPLIHAAPINADLIVPCCDADVEDLPPGLITKDPAAVTCTDGTCAICEHNWMTHNGPNDTGAPAMCDGDKHALCGCPGWKPRTGRRPESQVIHSRESLYARVFDVLRRSGVEDGEQLVRLMEQDRDEVQNTLDLCSTIVSSACLQAKLAGEPFPNQAALLERTRRARDGLEIGPPKPASE